VSFNSYCGGENIAGLVISLVPLQCWRWRFVP